METKLSELNGTVTDLPDPELYIRWLQLAAFLPVVRYNRLPTSYGDKTVSDTAISLALLRQNKVRVDTKNSFVAVKIDVLF